MNFFFYISLSKLKIQTSKLKYQTLLKASETVSQSIVLAKANHLVNTDWKINVKLEKNELQEKIASLSSIFNLKAI